VTTITLTAGCSYCSNTIANADFDGTTYAWTIGQDSPNGVWFTNIFNPVISNMTQSATALYEMVGVKNGTVAWVEGDNTASGELYYLNAVTPNQAETSQVLGTTGSLLSMGVSSAGKLLAYAQLDDSAGSGIQYDTCIVGTGGCSNSYVLPSQNWGLPYFMGTSLGVNATNPPYMFWIVPGASYNNNNVLVDYNLVNGNADVLVTPSAGSYPWNGNWGPMVSDGTYVYWWDVGPTTAPFKPGINRIALGSPGTPTTFFTPVVASGKYYTEDDDLAFNGSSIYFAYSSNADGVVYVASQPTNSTTATNLVTLSNSVVHLRAGNGYIAWLQTGANAS